MLQDNFHDSVHTFYYMYITHTHTTYYYYQELLNKEVNSMCALADSCPPQ